MGACASVQDRTALERSAEIDRQIEEDSRRFRKECKILLLGAWLLLFFFLSFFTAFALGFFSGSLERVYRWEGRRGMEMLVVVVVGRWSLDCFLDGYGLTDTELSSGQTSCRLLSTNMAWTTACDQE